MRRVAPVLVFIAFISIAAFVTIRQVSGPASKPLALAAAAPAAGPVVTVDAPYHFTTGKEFAVRALVGGCTPGSLVWTVAKGCTVTGRAGTAAIIQCSLKEGVYADIKATAKGGGCAAASGETSVLMAPEGQVTAFFPCDNDLPGAVVTPPPKGRFEWYYRPGLESTGKLGMQTTRETRVTLGCFERTK